MMESPEQNAPTIKTAQILWGALFMSIGLHLFVAHQVQIPRVVEGTPGSASLEHPFLMPLAIAGLVLFVMAFVIPKALLGSKAATPKEQMSKAFVAFIVRMAILEAVGILGLIISLDSVDLKAQLGFFVVSALGMLLAYPGQSYFENALQQSSTGRPL